MIANVRLANIKDVLDSSGLVDVLTDLLLVLRNSGVTYKSFYVPVKLQVL